MPRGQEWSGYFGMPYWAGGYAGPPHFKMSGFFASRFWAAA
jgi:hypothetical protein